MPMILQQSTPPPPPPSPSLAIRTQILRAQQQRKFCRGPFVPLPMSATQTLRQRKIFKTRSNSPSKRPFLGPPPGLRRAPSTHTLQPLLQRLSRVASSRDAPQSPDASTPTPSCREAYPPAARNKRNSSLYISFPLAPSSPHARPQSALSCFTPRISQDCPLPKEHLEEYNGLSRASLKALYNRWQRFRLQNGAYHVPWPTLVHDISEAHKRQTEACLFHDGLTDTVSDPSSSNPEPPSRLSVDARTTWWLRSQQGGFTEALRPAGAISELPVEPPCDLHTAWWASCQQGRSFAGALRPAGAPTEELTAHGSPGVTALGAALEAAWRLFSC